MIKDNLVQQGQLLFKYRGILPFLIIPLVLAYLPMLKYKSIYMTHILIWIGLAVSLIGLALRFINVGYTAKNTSGRNTKNQVADTLNTTGIYAMMRHPLYVFNYIVFIGFLLPLQSIQLLVITSVLYYFYYERICMTEEDFLEKKFGTQYREWSMRVHAFIPNLTKWKKPTQKFQWVKALRQEGPGLLLITCIFPCISLLIGLYIENFSLIHWISVNKILIGLIVIGFCGYGLPKLKWWRLTAIDNGKK